MMEESVKGSLADTRSAKEAIRVLLENTIQKEEEFPVGCFLVNTAVELAKHDTKAIDWVHLRWTYTEQLIRDLIVEGQQSGEFSKSLDAEGLSYYFINALIGLRVMVKTVSDREKLRQIIEMNMSVLE